MFFWNRFCIFETANNTVVWLIFGVV